MIKHIVCWKLKDAENNEINLHEIKKKLLNLKELISEIKNIEVGIIMGSDSDLPIMEDAVKILKEFGIGYEVKVL